MRPTFGPGFFQKGRRQDSRRTWTLTVLDTDRRRGRIVCFQGSDLPFGVQQTETNQKVVEGQGEENRQALLPLKVKSPPLPPSSSPNSASTPDSSSTSEEKRVVAPTETPLPLPSPTVGPRQTESHVQASPTPLVQTENPTPNKADRTDSDDSSGAGGEIQHPATLTKSEVDATREDVLKRINAMPRFTRKKKSDWAKRCRLRVRWTGCW